jgi:uncharacterized protein YndB with AHSA1/START domain
MIVWGYKDIGGMFMAMLAAIEKATSGYTARFERHLQHSVEEVWSWLTDNDKLGQWFDELRAGELRNGGYMTFDMGDDIIERLAITDYKEGSLLGFSWWLDSVRFEISPEDDGCMLVLIETIHTLTDHTPKDLAGWHVCLDVILALADGRDFGPRQDEWKKRYEEYIKVVNGVE